MNMVIDDSINNNVRKYPTRKRNTMVTQDVNYILIDTNNSIEYIGSISTT